MGPGKTAFRYGVVAVVAALVADLYFLVVDPVSVVDWILTVVHQYRTSLALATFVFVTILAARRVQPVRLDPDASWRALLVRDGSMCGVVIATMVGISLLLSATLQATLLAEPMRTYAREATPKIVSYSNSELKEVREGRVRRGDSPEKIAALPDPARPGEVRASLQPPALRDLGRSIANFVLRAVLLGVIGGVTGALRRSKPDPETTGEPKPG